MKYDDMSFYQSPACCPIPNRTPNFSFLYTVTTTHQRPVRGAALFFHQNQLNRGNEIKHLPESTDFIFSCYGIYEIIFSACAYVNEIQIPTTAQLILEKGETRIPESLSSELITLSGQAVVLNRTILLEIDAPCAIRLIHLEGDVSYSNAMMYLKKIG